METVSVRNAAELGAAVRAARLQAGLSQVDLAAEARIGRQWLVEFEAGGKLSAPFNMVMRVLQALELEVVLDPTITRRSADRPDERPAATEILARYTAGGPR
ncbi:MAG: helix-turn-helix domain-containing protein [Micropruina sp.]|uniref:helix-turn-helix domain-containing protein n=1 Tax=Micropruina sp. TaxID=2737536 RepID=UPI0039E3F5E1